MKCNKCYKQIKDKEEVQYDNSVYCEPCCKTAQWHNKVFFWGFVAIVVIAVVGVVIFCLKVSEDSKEK